VLSDSYAIQAEFGGVSEDFGDFAENYAAQQENDE
jgi:hypothetical protein